MKAELNDWVVAVHGGVGAPPKSKAKAQKMKVGLKTACKAAAALLSAVSLFRVIVA